MRRLLASAVVASALAGGASLASAQAPGCDSYSGACVSETATPRVSPEVSPKKIVKPRGTLTVTGGELVLLLTVGGAAVAGGTVLVAAGRNKKHAA